MARLLSGRVGVTSYSGLGTDRQQTNGFPSFLGLEEVEPNLGLPSNNDYVLHGDVNGKRFWAAGSGGASGAVDGITVQDQGVTPTGYGGSTTTVNFTGNGVTVEEAKISAGAGVEVAISTVTINKSTLNIQDANAFERITGVTTFRVGAGLSFVEIPTGQFSSGIVSVFSAADSKTDFQTDSGADSLQDIGIIRIGYGLTITEASSGIASIRPTGHMEYLNVTGIASAPVFDGNLTGNVTGNVVGNVTGDTNGTHSGAVTGNVTGDLTGDFNAGISTVTELQATTINATGIITTSSGFRAPAGSFGFIGDLNSAGISTIAFFSGTNINISGIATAAGGFVAPAGGSGFTGKLTGDVTGNINGGISTITTLSGTTATYTTFVGSVTGDVTGSSSQVDLVAETSDTTCSILFATNPTGKQPVKTSTGLTYNSSAGVLTATKFSGDGSLLTSIPAAQLTGTLPNIDGSSLNNVTTSTVDLTATNTTNAPHYMLFADSNTGVEAVRTDTDLTYNPGTNTLTAATFAGAATGITGDPNISVTNVTLKGDLLPDTDDTRNLGSAALGFANIYACDMHFSNNAENPNSVDGTWGDWTLQEGEENIYMLNNRTGKKYKINLTEV